MNEYPLKLNFSDLRFSRVKLIDLETKILIVECKYYYNKENILEEGYTTLQEIHKVPKNDKNTIK